MLSKYLTTDSGLAILLFAGGYWSVLTMEHGDILMSSMKFALCIFLC